TPPYSTLSLHDALPISFIANVPDKTPPTLVNARRSFSANTNVTVKFSEVVDATTANSAANYKINNGSIAVTAAAVAADRRSVVRSEEHTSELQSRFDLV